jgi:hypothetical protein
MSDFMGFGYSPKASAGGEDDVLKGLLGDIGINAPGNPNSTKVSERANERALSLWDQFSAYVQVGFSPAEAIQIVLTEIRNDN